jgi:hypothetical protein
VLRVADRAQRQIERLGFAEQLQRANRNSQLARVVAAQARGRPRLVDFDLDR